MAYATPTRYFDAKPNNPRWQPVAGRVKATGAGVYVWNEHATPITCTCGFDPQHSSELK